MLKDFLTEAISLLAEAVLGTPTAAKATHTCASGYHWVFQYEFYHPCGSCGADKKRKFAKYTEAGGRVCNDPIGCDWC
jgi:hypothetical protein